MGTTRILVVEDHALVREGTRDVLERDPTLEVVGEAGSAAEALEKVHELRPDVVLLDLSLPDRNGLTVLPSILEAHPGAKVVVLSAYDDDDYVFAAVEGGASAYLLKTMRGPQVVEAIHSVREGEVVLHPVVAEKLRGSLRRGGTGSHAALSPREMEILRLAGHGLRNKEIARSLCLSIRTVEGHLSHILTKLGVSSRTEAVLYAAAHGWFSEDR